MQVRNMTFRLKLLCFQTTEADEIATDEELKKKKKGWKSKTTKRE